MKTEEMQELYQIKRKLIDDYLRQRMPNLLSTKKPLSWWIETKIAVIEDLELVESKYD